MDEQDAIKILKTLQPIATKILVEGYNPNEEEAMVLSKQLELLEKADFTSTQLSVISKKASIDIAEQRALWWWLRKYRRTQNPLSSETQNLITSIEKWLKSQ